EGVHRRSGAATAATDEADLERLRSRGVDRSRDGERAEHGGSGAELGGVAEESAPVRLLHDISHCHAAWEREMKPPGDDPVTLFYTKPHGGWEEFSHPPCVEFTDEFRRRFGGRCASPPRRPAAPEAPSKVPARRRPPLAACRRPDSVA